jgi:aerobic carbon-monoxide dehydrogenase medium subunit
MIGINIHEPCSLEEAFSLLGEDDGSARPFGGGTALMLMMKARLFKPSSLVSLAKVDSRFHGIDFSSDGQSVSVGSMVTFTALEKHPMMRNLLPVIGQTMATLANPRVRNVATVGGNLAHGDPYLDLPPVWFSLDATISTIGPAGERSFPVGDLFAGYYENTLLPGELIMRVEAPIVPGWRRKYVKITTRSAHDWPAVGISIGLNARAGRCEDVRIVLSAATDRPTRLHCAEDLVRGQQLTQSILAEVGEVAAGEVDMVSDSRGSADYKAQLLKVHLVRALREMSE